MFSLSDRGITPHQPLTGRLIIRTAETDVLSASFMSQLIPISASRYLLEVLSVHQHKTVSLGQN